MQERQSRFSFLIRNAPPSSPIIPTPQVAEYCNERRLNARNSQDASLKMYLCVLLRKAPVVANAIVLQVGGDRYFNVYIPQYAIECRCVCSSMLHDCMADHSLCCYYV